MMKKIFLILTFFLLFLSVSVKLVSAQATSDPAKKYGITFPITELGNCTDIASCKTYCDDSLNTQKCVDYAKGKGFYKEQEAKPSDAVIQQAKVTLGCDSAASCKAFCEKQENYDKCHSFAQNTGLSGGYKEDPSKGTVLAKAETALGCTSYETCKTFCDNPINHDKCAQFAKSVGVNGGYEYKGPGGCTTEETCKTFCSQSGNIDICRQFTQSAVGQSNYDPQLECKKYPGCSWSGTYCQCNQNQNDPGNIERQKAQCTSYSGCSWIGTSCSCTRGSGMPYPTSYPTSTPSYGDGSKGDYSCGKASLAVGCYTVDKTCKCPSTFPSGNSGSGNMMSRDQQEAGYHAPGTNSPSSTQQPQASTSTDPATACGQTSGCTWTGSTCSCSSVHGASTENKSFLERVLQLLFGK